MWRILAAGLIWSVPCAQALAWGDKGHAIICAIALGEAKPATRNAIAALLAMESTPETFAVACSWPDHPRRRPAEHFVNLRRDATGLTGDGCPIAAKCVVSAIALDLARLSDPQADAATRLDALRFLGHWVGDVHQPLHVSFQDDRGGNKITVTTDCTGNMHAAWDVCLVERAVGNDAAAAATALAGKITAADRAAWIASSPTDWANESFAITTAGATHYCVMQNGACAYEVDNPTYDEGETQKTVVISDAYVAMSKPIVQKRLQQAGVRLAHLLDQALAP